MTIPCTLLAIDIGAESGRTMAVHFDGQRLTLDERYRFPNVPVRTNGTLHWDILRLWGDVQTGIKQTNSVETVDAIGIDTWAIDFGLLDRLGRLIGNPVHYRDSRTDGLLDRVVSQVPRAELFAQTGIQILPINTLYQLVSLVQRRDPSLELAERLLTIPDLLYYWLTGTAVNEFTNATTTQAFNTGTRDWAFELLDRLHIPTRLFQPVSEPGQILGKTDRGIPVVLVPHHDTACAVIGVPTTTPNFAYLSSGTWSLLGLEIDQPIINAQALIMNVTNEGGYGGTTRLLKNIMGLWLLQESRRTWITAGETYDYDQLAAMAQQSPAFVAFIDPDAPDFLAPGDMPARIRDFCARTGQPIPQTVGAVARCIFESLALKYRVVLDQLKTLTGRQVEVLHVVGGGSQNSLLCQLTADATNLPVVAGPTEATALGNAVAQLIALGELASVADGRALIRNSFALTTYLPQNNARSEAAVTRFMALLAY